MAKPTLQQPADRLKVFISYSRRDRETADALVEALVAHDYEVTIDRRDLDFGEKWQMELAEFIRLSDTVIWLVSEPSVKSEWVNWELDEVAKRKKRLVPVMIADTSRDKLPRQLGEIHILPLEGLFNLDRDLGALIRVLETDLAWLKEGSRLGDRAHEWLSRDRARALLLRGAALADAERWKQHRPPKAPAPTQEVFDLILASRQSAARRQRYWIGGSLAVTAGALALGFIALLQRNAAVTERDHATTETVLAQTSLANQVRREGDPLRGTLIAIEAFQTSGSSNASAAKTEAYDTLLGAFSELRESVYAPTGKKGVTTVVFSPDGNEFVVAGSPGAQLRERQTGGIIRELPGLEDTVHAAAFSSASGLILTGSANGQVRFWNSTGSSVLGTISAHYKPVWHLSFDRPEKQILTAGGDGLLKIWDASSRKLITTLDRAKPEATAHAAETQHDSEDIVRSAAFFAGGARVVAAYQDAQDVVVWDVPKHRIIGSLQAIRPSEARNAGPQGFGTEAYSVAISPDEKLVAVGSADIEIGIFDLAKLKLEKLLSGHTERVFAVAFSPDGSRLASGSRDGTVRLWDVASGENYATLKGHTGSVYSVQFSPVGRFVLSGSQDGSSILWDTTDLVESRLRLQRVTIANPNPDTPTVEPDEGSSSSDGSRKLRRGDDDNRDDHSDPYLTYVWDVRQNRQLAAIRGIAGVVNAARLSPDGGKLVTAERNGQVIVWDAADPTPDGKELFRCQGHNDQAEDAKFSPNGKFIISGGRDGTAVLCDAENGSTLLLYRGHGSWVENVAFSPDSSKILSWGGDGRARLWSSVSGTDILSLKLSSPQKGLPDGQVAFSPDGKRIVFTDEADDHPVETQIDILVPPDELVERAARGVPRCLTQPERRQLSLAPAPPDWCITGVGLAPAGDPHKWQPKWPYQTDPWRAWLLARYRGEKPQLPSTK
jgi:WD40 repeat protein